MRFALPTCVLFLVIGLVATAVYAESVVWSGPQPDLVAVRQTYPTMYLYDPMVSISYRTQVFESDANGAKTKVLASGDTLPVGSWVLFEFSPHEYTDISWFGTGGTYDSPFGDWLADAAAPPASERCTPKNLYRASASEHDLYAAFSVNPPAKSILMAGEPAACQTVGSTNLLCQFQQAGTVSATFTFAPTTGKFYGGEINPDPRIAQQYGCQQEDTPFDIWSGSGKGTKGTFSLGVPRQTIPFALNVIDNGPPENPTNSRPATPYLTSGGACIVGTPHTLSFVSTDPDSDNLRYGVDWNADGSVDQWVPPSGFVPSGTTQSASRTYSTTGTKTVQIMAQDEGGLTSGRPTLSFDCADSATAGLNEFNNSGGGDGSHTFLPPATDLDLRAVPSLLRQGATTKVSWSAQNVRSCTVQGDNGDGWSGLQSPIGGETSTPIQGQTTYTLSCIDLDGVPQTKQATVRIIPTFQEL